MDKRAAVDPGRIFIYAFLIIGSIMMVYPMIYAVMGSLNTMKTFFITPWFPFPYQPTFENYLAIFTPTFNKTAPLGKWIINTLVRIAWFIVVPGTVAVLAGYVFARLKFWG